MNSQITSLTRRPSNVRPDVRPDLPRPDPILRRGQETHRGRLPRPLRPPQRHRPLGRPLALIRHRDGLLQRRGESGRHDLRDAVRPGDGAEPRLGRRVRESRSAVGGEGRGEQGRGDRVDVDYGAESGERDGCGGGVGQGFGVDALNRLA